MNIQSGAIEQVWNRRSRTLEAGPRLPVARENEGLLAGLLNLTGFYLGCLSRGSEHLRFGYQLRQERPGFLKLDVNMRILVVGARVDIGPVDQLLSVVEKFWYLRNASGREAFGFGFVPIVAFGESLGFQYYIESPHGFGMVDPFFIEAAHEFIARRLLPRYAGAESGSIQLYLECLRRGEDPKQVVAREPLIGHLLDQAPTEVRGEMLRQIANDLEARLTRGAGFEPTTFGS